MAGNDIFLLLSRNTLWLDSYQGIIQKEPTGRSMGPRMGGTQQAARLDTLPIHLLS